MSSSVQGTYQICVFRAVMKTSDLSPSFDLREEGHSSKAPDADVMISNQAGQQQNGELPAASRPPQFLDGPANSEQATRVSLGLAPLGELFRRLVLVSSSSAQISVADLSNACGELFACFTTPERSLVVALQAMTAEVYCVLLAVHQIFLHFVWVGAGFPLATINNLASACLHLGTADKQNAEIPLPTESDPDKPGGGLSAAAVDPIFLLEGGHDGTVSETVAGGPGFAFTRAAFALSHTVNQAMLKSGSESAAQSSISRFQQMAVDLGALGLQRSFGCPPPEVCSYC